MGQIKEIECAVCDQLIKGAYYGWYPLCTEHLEMAKGINGNPDNFQASVIVCGLRHKIRRDATWAHLMKRWSETGATCTACGATLGSSDPDASWRWNGENWEHKCPGIDLQCGHFSAKTKGG